MNFSYKKIIASAIFIFFVSCNTYAIKWVKDPHHGWYVGEIPSGRNQSYNNTYDYSYSACQTRHHQAVINTLNYINSNSSSLEKSWNNGNSTLSTQHAELREFALDQARKMMAYDEANRDRINGYTQYQSNILRELDVSKGQYLKNSHDYLWDSTLILKDVQTVQDLLNALSNPTVRARLERLKYEYKQRCCKTKQVNFIDSLLSGKITQLLIEIQNPNITISEAAITQLKHIWPWDRQHSYLVEKRPSGESKFISILGIDIMKIAERDFITSPGFIAKHTNSGSLQAIEKYKAQCALLQQKGDFKGLQQQQERLEKIVKKNGKKANIANNICLAIAQKALANPITNIFHTIIRAPHIKYAGDALVQGRTRILQQARQENIPSDKIHEWVISKYGYDAIEEMRDCYKFRYDYTGHEPIQEVVLSERSESLSPILYNIQDRKLPEAYNELIHCNSHVDRILAEENITDPQAQTEYLIKNFDADVREVTQNVYKNRTDHQNLVKNFTPINVSHVTTTILNNNDNCGVIADLLRDVSEQVINNAQLCDLDHVPEIQDQLVQSLHVIREPKNPAEFIVHVTMVDHILTDMQCQTNAMVTGKPTLWERSPDLLFRALTSFLSRLNPVTQLQDIGSLFVGAGTFLGNRTLDIITDPITTTKNSIETTLYVIDFISTLARLTSDTTYGLHYLSTQECQQRIGRYGENIVILGHLIDKSSENITAEQVADATGHIIGDIVFAAGAPAVATFVKEIDALGKISNEAKVIARGIKNVVEEHPAYVTAEGIVLKMGQEIKDIKNAAGPFVESFQNLFEKAYAPIGNEIKSEIDNIRSLYHLAKDELLTCAGKPLKIAYHHILGMEPKWHKGCIDKLGGFHHDLAGIMENSELVKLSNKIVKNNGCYIADVIIEGKCFRDKTFFPQDWPRQKVIDKICEAYKNSIKEGNFPLLGKDGKYSLQCYTNEGIEIAMYISQNGELKTAYPIIKRGI